MRLGIAAKLAILLSAIVLLAAGLTGYYVFRVGQRQLLESAENKLLTANQVLARRIITAREAVSADLLLLSQHPATLQMLQKPTPQAQADLLTLLSLTMQIKPSYLQVRLVGSAQHGLEVMRVERHGGAIKPTPDDDLLEKGHVPFVYETLKLPSGTTYMSRIAINHDSGIYAAEGKPSLQLAMPVLDAQGHALGVVAINLDLQNTFKQLSRDLPSSFRLYMSNEEGDILIHPDPDKTFGFDKGRRTFMQDEFPMLKPLYEDHKRQIVFETHNDPNQPLDVAAAFVKIPVQVASEENYLVLGLAQPLDELLAEASELAARIVNISLLLALGAIVLGALVVAQLITRPLKALHRATLALGSDRADTAMPLQHNDEIGDLARNIQAMKKQIREQIQTLEDNQEEFEFLAHHDILTDLPNRRLLVDRLMQAIARAQRHGEQLAVLFVDLDRFKEVNDEFGHEGGDTVLKTVAHRLQSLVRATDTVARIGGDEFVILVDAPKSIEDITAVASRVVESLNEPIHVGQDTAHIGASVGISLYPDDGTSAEGLLMTSDRAMYRAKATGRNGYRYATTPASPPPAP